MNTQDKHHWKNCASLKPAFAKDGTVTAGNSSGINDGAAAMLLASEDAVKKYELKPTGKNCFNGCCRSRSVYYGYWPGTCN